MPSKERAAAAESCVSRIFREQGFEVTPNARAATPRQTDLFATYGAQEYLVEVKAEQRRLDVGATDGLSARLQEGKPSVVGVLVSLSGFTDGLISWVKGHRQRPVLLLDAEDLKQLSDRSLPQLLRRRARMLTVHATVEVGSLQVRPIHATSLADVPEPQLLDADGAKLPWIVGPGEYGPMIFVSGLLFDIDWQPASGFGVTLDVPLSGRSVEEIVRELSSQLWISDRGSWAIQQSDIGWYGYGARSFLNAVENMPSRYEQLENAHHTEELRYYDLCPNGFYTLKADVSANDGTVWEGDLSIQLSGIPVDPTPLHHLLDRLDVDASLLYFRPRDEPSIVTRRWRGDTQIEPLEFVAPAPHVVRDLRGDERWISGFRARNPFAENEAGTPDGWPSDLRDASTILYSLRHHHTSEEDVRYRLCGWEYAWTSNACCIRVIADWT